MLIATLVNLEGEAAICEVVSWKSKVPPYALLRDNRQFIIDPRNWQDGEICKATFNEVSPTRTINISGLPLQKAQVEDQEEAA
jgi:hypothetical protein